MNECNTLRYIYALKSEAVAERMRTDIGNGIRQDNAFNLRYVHEGEYAYSGQNATLFEYDLGHILIVVCKCVVTYGSNILAYGNRLNVVRILEPRCISVAVEISHGTVANNLKFSVGIELPAYCVIAYSAINQSNNAFASYILNVVIPCIFLCNRACHNIQYQIGISFIENVRAQIDNRIGNKYDFQLYSMTECRMFDCMQLASGFHIHILKLAALIERILFKHFKTCREGNASKAPAVTECTPTNALQIGAFLKAYAPEILVAVEAESADMGDAIADYQRSDRCGFILDDPHRIVTIGCVILHNAFAANLKCAVGQKDIIKIGAGEAGIHNGSVRRGNKFTLFAEGTGVTPDFYIAADSIAVLVKEISSGESVDFACHFLTGCKVHILALSFVIVEAAEFCLACANAVIAEIVIVAVDLLQTGEFHTVTVIGLIHPAVCYDNAIYIGFTICIFTTEEFSAAHTLQYAVNEFITVTGCRNGRAPVNHGVTYLAEGTSGVAGFGAGGGFVFDCGCGVDMTAVPSRLIILTFLCFDHELLNSPSLGITEHVFTGEGIGCAISQGYSTLLYADIHSNPPVLVLALEPCVGVLVALRKDFRATANFAAYILQFPNADRNGNQCLFAVQRGLAGLGDRQVQNLIGSVIGIGDLKALCDLHVIQLPLVHAVEVQSRSNSLNIGNISCHHIHIVEGTEKDAIQCCIVRNDLHADLFTGGDVHLADNRGVVALLIADGELDGMLTCGKNHAVVHCDRAVLICAGNLITVHISLGGRSIQAGGIGLSGILSNKGGEVHGVVADIGTVFQYGCIGHTVRCIVHIGEDGGFTILHNGRIVYGDIINVDSEVAVDIGIFLGIVVVRCAVAVGDIELHAVIPIKPHSALIAAEIAGQIVPAGLVKGVHHAGTAGSIVHCITGDRIRSNRYIALFVNRRNGIQHPTSPEADILIRNVNPHTNALRADQRTVTFLSLRRQTVQCGHHVAGFLRIGVVNIDTQGIVTSVNLAVFRISNKGGAVGQVVVILDVSGLKAIGRAIFKVKEDFRPLTESQGCFGSQLGTCKLSGNGGTGHAGSLFAGREAQTADRSGSLILQSKGEVIGIGHDFIQTVGCYHFQCGGLAKRNRNGIGCKLDCLRNHTVNGHRANSIVTKLRGQNHIAGSGSSQNTAFICAVFHFVCNFRGNLCRSTCRRNAGNGYVRGRTDGQILVLCYHADMVKNIRGYSGRGDDDTVGDGTLGAVGRTVLNRTLVRTLVLCDEGGGAAAVQVEGSHATGLQHDLSQLVHGTAAGERLLTTVQDADDQLAICSNTNHGTGVAVGIIAAGSIGSDILAVPNQSRTEDVDCFLDTSFLAGIPSFLGVIDDSRAVIQDRKEYGVGRLIPILFNITSHDEHTTGLTSSHIVSIAVACRYNGIILADELGICGVAVLFICTGDHVGQLVHAVYIILHILVCNLSYDIVTGQVGSGHIVNHLLAVFCVGVIGVIRYTGGKGLLRVLKHGVSFRLVVFVVVFDFRKYGHRYDAHKHHCTKNHSQNF